MEHSARSVGGFAQGRVDVFHREHHNLVCTHWNGNQWQHDTLHQGNVASEPAPIVGFASGRMDVFWRGTDDSIYDTWWNGQKWETAKLGGHGNVRGTPFPLVGFQNGRIDAFWVGKDGSIYSTWWNGSQWRDDKIGKRTTSTLRSNLARDWI